MPLRRRPSPDPSPRLRAVLERAQRTSGGAAALRAPRTSGGAAALRAPRTAGGDDARGDDFRVGDGPLEFWQPDRAWLEAAHSAPASSGAVGEPAGSAVVAGVDSPPASSRPGRHRRPSTPAPAWLLLPDSLRGARLTAPRAAVVGVLLLAVVAAAVFGVRVAMARAASEPRPITPTVTGGAAGQGSTFAASTTSDAGGGGPPTATAGAVTVHVVGQVAHPGVVRLPAGSRVADAIAKAGGAGRKADLGAINLARVLVDGEQVRVPKPGEVVAAGGAGPGGGSSGGAAGPASGGGSGGAGADGKVNLNTATQGQLEELPGVGPVLAQRILDWRTEHGRFTSVDELGEVSGIGEKILSQLQPKVTV